MASGEEHYYSKTDVSKSIRWVVALVIGTIAMVLGIILIASTISHSRGDSSQNAAAMTDAAVAARIKAVGEAKVDPNQPAADAAPAPAALVADAAPAAAPADQAASAPGADATQVAAAAATTAAAATAAAPAAAADGKATYEQACVICHGAGIAGAPKLGDKTVWGPRVAIGKDALYTSALKGKNAMPAKGGNAALADDAVKAAVDYMLSQAQ